MNREDIQIVTRNSTISESDVNVLFEKNVYTDKQSWQKFIELFFLSLGIGFTVAGILFFFAYNWDNLDKFVKIGLVESLIIVATLIAVFSKIKTLFKNILLIGSTMLVGVLFAVFGQIYQTGANAYDFFLGWTMAVSLWVLVSNFLPLWLIFIILINVTFGLYIEQVAHDWNDLFVFSVFIILNTLFLVGALLLKHNKNAIPKWFIQVLSITVISFVTIAMFNGIFENNNSYLKLVVLLMLIIFTFGIMYGLKQKTTFYIAIIALSIVLIFTAWLIDFVKFNDFSMLLFIGIFVVVAITLVIKLLINLQKKWKHEN